MGLPSRMNLVVGRLTCNPGGFGFVVPEKKAPREADIYVAAVNDQLKLFGLVEMVLFILTVFVAYAYVWRRGGLEWE